MNSRKQALFSRFGIHALGVGEGTGVFGGIRVLVGGDGQVDQRLFHLRGSHEEPSEQIVPLRAAGVHAHQLPARHVVMALIDQGFDLDQSFCIAIDKPTLFLELIQARPVSGVDIRHFIVGPVPLRPRHEAIRMPAARQLPVGEAYFFPRGRGGNVQYFIGVQVTHLKNPIILTSKHEQYSIWRVFLSRFVGLTHRFTQVKTYSGIINYIF